MRPNGNPVKFSSYHKPDRVSKGQGRSAEGGRKKANGGQDHLPQRLSSLAHNQTCCTVSLAVFVAVTCDTLAP